MSQPISLGAISEIILYVSDMEKQVRFYRDTMGLAITWPADLEDCSEEFWVTFSTGACTLALHGGGENDFGRDAPRYVFDVENIEETRSAFQARSIPVSEIRNPAPGIAVFDARDPEGNLFSIESRE